MKIYTRTGDSGDTSLFGGGRVSKAHRRVSAYGDVDELNCAIGAARAGEPLDFEADLLDTIQRDLLSIGGQLASPDPTRVEHALQKTYLPEARIADFESFMDRADEELPPLDAFVLPGGTMKAALLHQARSVCRRAERQVVALHRESPVPSIILIYLNRLSDLLFTLARLANHRGLVQDRTW